MASHSTISIIIPVLNEVETLADTIGCVRETENIEVIVVDGGSIDATLSVAGKIADHVISTTASRGGQMDVGAEKARGDILLFLHADTLLPKRWGFMVREAIESGKVGGAFSLSIYPFSISLRIVSFIANIRSRFLGITYGDQAIFVKRDIFRKVGGFNGLPIFEDIDLWRRMKRCGRVTVIKDSVYTSSRRWKKKGVIVTTVKNIFLIMSYYIGLSSQRLYKQYYIEKT
ncbi:MAG: TIGR04283 family arsenosugar biosynthesis glycosyltransferase [Thermodesulfobacteriota bacterium]